MLAAVLAQTFSKTLVIADYYTNTAKYVNNCENKARPQMHCNGQCQLMKKMHQDENRSKKNPERRNNNTNELQYFTTIQLTLKSFSSLTASAYLPFNSTIPKAITFDIFQPPRPTGEFFLV